MIAYNFIKTVSPTLMLPRKHPKTKEQPLSRTNTTDHLIFVAIIISLPYHYQYHNDFNFTNNIACYTSLEAIITTVSKTAIIIATIFGKSNDNNDNEVRTQEPLNTQARALLDKG